MSRIANGDGLNACCHLSASLVGFVVAVCAVALLVERTRRKPPEDYQRMRWVV
jgi:hypothetical protein